MGAAEEQQGSAAEPWLLRPFGEGDEAGMMYLLGVAYSRSKAGWRAGASGAGRTRDDSGSVRDEDVNRQRAFLAAHTPVWRWLLANADVTLAVDRDRPDEDIWGWMITSGADVLHAIGCNYTGWADAGLLTMCCK